MGAFFESMMTMIVRISGITSNLLPLLVFFTNSFFTHVCLQVKNTLQRHKGGNFSDKIQVKRIVKNLIFTDTVLHLF